MAMSRINGKAPLARLLRMQDPLLPAVLLPLLAAGPAAAWVEMPDDIMTSLEANPVYVTDGSYVMNAGNLHINITNFGLIGSQYSSYRAWSNAPSAQWPAGSGDEYLWCAGLWVGGVLLGERLVSTGQYEFEMRALPNPEDTIYEAIGTKLLRPAGNTIASGRRFPDVEPNDDDDYDEFGNPRIDEEILNGYDDDGDGLIDEDFGQIGNQMMVATLYDNTRAATEAYPDHKPLNLKIVQSSYAWENAQVRDFVGFDYTITNIGVTDIENIYIGMFADPDIGPRSVTDTASDDLAGSFSGAVRASDGSWVPVEVGYMYDWAESGQLEGFFGVAFLGHATDPTGVRAPPTVKLRAFRRFNQQAPFDQGGDPTNDAERYEVLCTEQRDSDVNPLRKDDYRFVVSAGPFQRLRPDEDLTFQVALVVGPGLNGLLRNCAEAALTFYGNYFDTIPPQPHAPSRLNYVVLGENGRETMICQEDFDQTTWDNIFPDFGDLSCMPSLQWLQDNFPTMQQNAENLFFYKRDPANPNRESVCTMVNYDNCFECFRQKPHVFNEPPELAQCSQSELEQYWNCHDPTVADFQKSGCTGVGGRETRISWLVGMAPPPPGMRIWPTDREVHVFWDNRSEITPDVRLNTIDFQSYRIWRADNWKRPYGSDFMTGPGANLWQLVAEYDVVDSFTVAYELSEEDTFYVKLPLGRNTGLDDIRYEPTILLDDRFSGLADSMRVVADNDPDGLYNDALPPLFDRYGVPLPLTAPLLQWQGYPAALDTFWAVTARPETSYVDSLGEFVRVTGKDPVWYYKYIDPQVHNGYIYFYSVTATDHQLRAIPGTDPQQYEIVGPGLIGDPGSSFTHTAPAKRAQTAEERSRQGANIFVYPNPATRTALREFQQLFASSDDPTGVRVQFANLPAARNTIKIFTLSGDLVQTIEHDGRGGYGEANWNLISRNGQEIVSGIYLYVVQSDDSGFDDFIGKFVVVR